VQDTLLHLNAASPLERAINSDYHWNNQERSGRNFIFQYTWTGQGFLQRDQQPVPCPAGHALMMMEGDATRYYFAEGDPEPWVFAWINFSGAEALGQRLISHYGDVCPFHPEGETISILKILTRLYRDKGFQDRYHASDLLSRFLSALARELSAGRQTRPIIHQVRDYLQDHHRRAANIKEVAARFDLSREHLARLFLATFHQPPGQFLRDLRLQTARQLLLTTRLPIHEVASQSGFSSPTHFCRMFRKMSGLTPEEFRNRSRAQTDKRPQSKM
jgi:AraC-like DNA-binding protein